MNFPTTLPLRQKDSWEGGLEVHFTGGQSGEQQLEGRREQLKQKYRVSKWRVREELKGLGLESEKKEKEEIEEETKAREAHQKQRTDIDKEEEGEKGRSREEVAVGWAQDIADSAVRTEGARWS